MEKWRVLLIPLLKFWRRNEDKDKAKVVHIIFSILNQS